MEAIVEVTAVVVVLGWSAVLGSDVLERVHHRRDEQAPSRPVVIVPVLGLIAMATGLDAGL